jgi:hypothetical protein
MNLCLDLIAILRRQERVERSEQRKGFRTGLYASLNGPPDHAIAATAFAETLSGEFVRQGGDIHTLFAAFAGLVSARDKKVCADCLVAPDKAFFATDSKPQPPTTPPR